MSDVVLPKTPDEESQIGQAPDRIERQRQLSAAGAMLRANFADIRSHREGRWNWDNPQAAEG